MMMHIEDDNQNRSECSCRYLKCSYHGTRCIDNPDEPGIIQLPCIRGEMPSLDLCRKCCQFGYLAGICAYMERA